jgi:hypothetical protein
MEIYIGAFVSAICSTVAVLGSGAALLSPAFAPDRRSQRTPRSQVVVPGRRGSRTSQGERLRAAAAGRHTSLRIQVCSRERALNERGCESCSADAKCSQEGSYNVVTRLVRPGNGHDDGRHCHRAELHSQRRRTKLEAHAFAQPRAIASSCAADGTHVTAVLDDIDPCLVRQRDLEHSESAGGRQSDHAAEQAFRLWFSFRRQGKEASLPG